MMTGEPRPEWFPGVVPIHVAVQATVQALGAVLVIEWFLSAKRAHDDAAQGLGS
jgi:hypothetical protein